ncbi:TonB-dependent receptor plug domain-containing protein [Aquidulcibacter sp.]|uniref:TonB-dependent receptor plug domain-containing protein n=1 Tax=Aquidulcibacter sp. TaxID=2052990 RepID=UPI0025B7B2F4|nr:TonB-dependent receptor plug domain-containing protein [Aquidulcibacter sp.]
MRFGVSTISVLALAWGLATVTPAAAETAPSSSILEDGLAVPGASDELAPETETVIVTARRRNEAAQDIPIAVSVVGGRQLDQTGSFNVGRLTQLAPTLTFYSSNPRNSAANIRGLGAPFGLTNDGIEQGVGIYMTSITRVRRHRPLTF